MENEKLKFEQYHKQPDENSFLYRYVTIDKLLDFFLSGQIPLVRLTEFQDKLEGVDIQHLLLNFAGDKIAEELKSKAVGGIFKHITTNIFPTSRNNFRRQRRTFQKTNFATCWYESNHESVAMWHLYSRPDSVAIRIPFKSLQNELVNNHITLAHSEIVKMRFGSVDYNRFNDLDELSKIVIRENTQGFFKDASFAHEREFRIMIEIANVEEKKVEGNWVMLDEQVEKINMQSTIKIIPLSLINFKSLPFEIIFHPQSFDWHRKNVEKIIEKLELQFKTSESALREIFN